MEPTIVNAIQNLCRKNHVGAAFTITGDNESIKDLSTTILRDGGSLEFTFEDATNELASLKAEYDAQEYARNRAAEYPSNGDQWDMIYKDNKNNTTTHADAVEAVKTKWPKDNSGPK